MRSVPRLPAFDGPRQASWVTSKREDPAARVARVPRDAANELIALPPIPQIEALNRELEELGTTPPTAVASTSVLVRVSPPSRPGAPCARAESGGPRGDAVVVRDPFLPEGATLSQAERRLAFSHVVGPSADHAACHRPWLDAAAPWIVSRQLNLSIVAIGGRGAGKSHLLWGAGGGTSSDAGGQGIVSRVVDDCLRACRAGGGVVAVDESSEGGGGEEEEEEEAKGTKTRGAGRFRVGVSCWEIVGDCLVDLLDPSPRDDAAAHPSPTARPRGPGAKPCAAGRVRRSWAGAGAGEWVDARAVAVSTSGGVERALRAAQARSSGFGDPAAIAAGPGARAAGHQGSAPALGGRPAPLPNRAHFFLRLAVVDTVRGTVATVTAADLVGLAPGSTGGAATSPGKGRGDDPLAPAAREARSAARDLLSVSRLLMDLSRRPDPEGGASAAPRPVPAARDGRLAETLAPLLGGNGRCHLAAVVSPDADDHLATLETLRLAARAATVRTACLPCRLVVGDGSADAPPTAAAVSAAARALFVPLRLALPGPATTRTGLRTTGGGPVGGPRPVEPVERAADALAFRGLCRPPAAEEAAAARSDGGGGCAVSPVAAPSPRPVRPPGSGRRDSTGPLPGPSVLRRSSRYGDDADGGGPAGGASPTGRGGGGGSTGPRRALTWEDVAAAAAASQLDDAHAPDPALGETARPPEDPLRALAETGLSQGRRWGAGAGGAWVAADDPAAAAAEFSPFAPSAPASSPGPGPGPGPRRPPGRRAPTTALLSPSPADALGREVRRAAADARISLRGLADRGLDASAWGTGDDDPAAGDVAAAAAAASADASAAVDADDRREPPPARAGPSTTTDPPADDAPPPSPAAAVAALAAERAGRAADVDVMMARISALEAALERAATERDAARSAAAEWEERALEAELAALGAEAEASPGPSAARRGAGRRAPAPAGPEASPRRTPPPSPGPGGPDPAGPAPAVPPGGKAPADERERATRRALRRVEAERDRLLAERDGADRTRELLRLAKVGRQQAEKRCNALLSELNEQRAATRQAGLRAQECAAAAEEALRARAAAELERDRTREARRSLAADVDALRRQVLRLRVDARDGRGGASGPGRWARPPGAEWGPGATPGLRPGPFSGVGAPTGEGPPRGVDRALELLKTLRSHVPRYTPAWDASERLVSELNLVGRERDEMRDREACLVDAAARARLGLPAGFGGNAGTGDADASAGADAEVKWATSDPAEYRDASAGRSGPRGAGEPVALPRLRSAT